MTSTLMQYERASSEAEAPPQRKARGFRSVEDHHVEQRALLVQDSVSESEAITFSAALP